MAIARESDACWVIPSEDEWYKAAYHKNDGATDHYWDYPTSTDTLPSNDLLDPDPGNNANFYQNDYTVGPTVYLTQVGEFESTLSPYGTFDQGGNVAEWNESALYESSRCTRGASYHHGSLHLHAAHRYATLATSEYKGVGFRVVEIRSPVGDLNCDGWINNGDIDAFVYALSYPDQYPDVYPDCDIMRGDINADGWVNNGDIDAFVALLGG